MSSYHTDRIHVNICKQDPCLQDSFRNAYLDRYRGIEVEAHYTQFAISQKKTLYLQSYRLIIVRAIECGWSMARCDPWNWAIMKMDYLCVHASSGWRKDAFARSARASLYRPSFNFALPERRCTWPAWYALCFCLFVLLHRRSFPHWHARLALSPFGPLYVLDDCSFGANGTIIMSSESSVTTLPHFCLPRILSFVSLDELIRLHELNHSKTK